MNRKISFTNDGHIRVETSLYTEVISSGVVLLTQAQAAVARNYGWEPFGTQPFAVETDPPLWAVRKGVRLTRPCGECHLRPGERCDICGCHSPPSL